jgi:peptidoglycan/xylan/chitin deacetylase (PgdA/CDA1 family)
MALALILAGCKTSGPRGRALEAGPEARTTVILTFDDGPVSVHWRDPTRQPADEDEMLSDLRRILEVLERAGVQAVFYVTYVEADPNAPPDSPKRSPERMEAVFARGCREIHEAGHIVAMHAVNHDMYQDPFLATEMAVADLQRLQAQLDATGVPYARTWRIPYGGLRAVFYSPDKTAMIEGVTVRGWVLDSQDWTAHYDAAGLLQRRYRDDLAWLKNVKLTLWNHVGKKGVGADPWADILLHVNPYTAAYLESIKRAVEEAFMQHYGATHWGRIRWLRADSTEDQATLNTYLGVAP